MPLDLRKNVSIFTVLEVFVKGKIPCAGDESSGPWQRFCHHFRLCLAAWQGRGAPRLEELSQQGQARSSQHWSPEGKRSGERKRPTFHPPRSRMICVQPGLLALFRGQPWGDCLETGRSAYWPFRALRCHLELKLKPKL